MADDSKEDRAAEAAKLLEAAKAATEKDSAADTSGKPVDSKKPTMSVKVYAPFQVYFTGEANSVTAANETGVFDVLPRHHNFLCMLVPCDLVIKTPYEVKTVKISRALLHVRADKLTVFVDV